MSSKSVILVAGTALAAVLLATLVPAFIRTRNTTTSKSCVVTLMQLNGAKQEWAVDYNKNTNDVPTWEDLRPYLRGSASLPTCPKGGSYMLGNLDEPPKCSLGGPDHTLPQ